MFQFPQGDDKNQVGGVQAPNRQSTIVDNQNFGASSVATSPLDSPLNSISPRMSLSPQPSMTFDAFNIPPNGTLSMNNYITSGMPPSPGFSLQTNSSLMVNPGQNNIQIQNLQLQIQQIQLQIQMMQQQALQSPPMSPQLGQMQSQIQMLQSHFQMTQTQLQLLLQQNPMNPQLLQMQTQLQMLQSQLQIFQTQTFQPTIVGTKPYGVASAYVTPNTLSQADIINSADKIKDAVNSISMDPSRLINIIGKFTPNQMNQVIECYISVNKQNLESVVKNETSGNFGKLCCALSKTILDYDVWCIYNAIKGLGTDDDCLIDILIGRNNSDLITLNKAYKETYNKTLEDHVKSDTSGNYRTTLVNILQGNRNETNIERDVETDVDALYKAGEGKVGTNESTFVTILTSRSYSHLQKVFDKYQQKYAHSMEKAINNEFSGNIKKALIGIVRTTKNLSEYIAEQFEDSMKGMGTKNDKLIRLVVRYREPLLMKKIKEDYARLYGKSLAKRIEGETNGDFRKLLLTCIGEL